MTIRDSQPSRSARRRPPADAEELERLLTAASAGDRTAVSELVQRFGPRVLRGARAYGLGTHDVEDVMQTTWLRLLQYAHTVRNPDVIGAWLETTARRESVRVLRANARERPTDDENVFDAPVSPMDEQPRRTPERSAAALAVALRQLTDRQRKLLSMLFADPAPCYTEVSRALGVPIGSIGPTRARSLARLRENPHVRELAEEYLDDAP